MRDEIVVGWVTGRQRAGADVDGRRLDRLAIAIGSGASRRGLLKLLGSGLAAGIGAALLGRGPAAAQAPCASNDECPEDAFCINGECLAIECRVDDECPEGARCNGFFCEPVECVTDDDCPTGETCDAGVCVAPPPLCSGERGPCDAGQTCCDGLECDPETGVCEVACVVGGPCLNVPDCCAQLVCNSEAGVCVEPDACAGLGVGCGDALCCNPYVCSPDTGACCTPGGRRCQADADCCDGVCFVGFCATDRCRLPGEPCDEFAQCCTAVCNLGACEASGCASVNAPCASNLECCTGVCAEGWCVLANCVEDTDCPVGGSCVNGACRYRTCATDADCPDDGEVCAGASNDFPGVCQPVPDGTCDVEGDACESDLNCCKDLACIDGTCQFEEDTDTGGASSGTTSGRTTPGTTTLPDTGAGDGSGDGNGLLGLGLAAGAVAFIAGNRLRGQAAE